MHRRRLAAPLFLAVVCLALGRATGAHADRIIVMNTHDSGTGSLRQAIADSTTGTGILFDASIQGQTIELNSALVIDKQMGIDGSTAGMTLKAVSSTSVLEANSPGMNLANLHVEGGHADHGGAILVTTGQFNFHDGSIKNSTADTNGGGLYVSTNASAILDNVVIDGNTAGQDGGGIYTDDLVSMDVTLVKFTNNHAGRDGGGVSIGNGSPIFEVVTFADNSAGRNGGGLFSNGFFGLDGTVSGNHATGNGGGFYISAGDAVLRNATISGNTADNGGAIDVLTGATIEVFSGTITENTGGGIRLAGTLKIETTIIADQTTGAGCVLEGNATVVSNGYNLSTDRTCRFTHVTDIEDGFANLSPLTLDPADTYVKTHAPQEGSDALNRIPIDPDASPHGGGPPDHSVRCGVTLAIDARSVLRAQGPGCEIGAYEAIQTKLPRIWGDNLCDGAIDAGDSLTELAYVAGVPWQRVNGCISIGSLVSGDALPANALQWADTNCDGALTAVDALNGLLKAVSLPRDNGPACPFIGKSVNLLG